MSDTLQVVSWSLDRPCQFRTGENWYQTDVTSSQLRRLRTVAEAATDGRIVDGICVTSHVEVEDSTWHRHHVPYDGFWIDEALAGFGGINQAAEVCGSCEANCSGRFSASVVGCFGYLYVWPDSKELDDAMRKIITTGTLDAQLRQAFPVTNPLWYGFWINSPLRRPQAELLFQLLNVLTRKDESSEHHGAAHFLNALKAAIVSDLPLHVSLTSPGHTDLGYVTTFPHCPRCKAEAPFKRWQGSYPTTPYTCHACGDVYIPAETYLSEPDDDDWEADSLEKLLEAAWYDQFVKRYLIQKGRTELQADDVVGIVRRKREYRRSQSSN